VEFGMTVAANWATSKHQLNLLCAIQKLVLILLPTLRVAR